MSASRAMRAAARANLERRYQVWYVFDADALEDEANGELIVASCKTQACAIWRKAYGLGAADLGEDQLCAEPAEWDWPGVPEPVFPRRPGVWWPGGSHEQRELFRGYGAHLVDDHCCECCGEYVAKLADEFLCSDCAVSESLAGEGA